jgi:hypothetical protein
LRQFLEGGGQWRQLGSVVLHAAALPLPGSEAADSTVAGCLRGSTSGG